MVVAEVYPSLSESPVPGPGEVKDLAQVRELTAEHFAKLDEAGKLGAVFAPGKDVPAEVVEAPRPKKAGFWGRNSPPLKGRRSASEPARLFAHFHPPVIHKRSAFDQGRILVRTPTVKICGVIDP